MNRALIAAALPRYLEKGHQGVMVPCAYHKKKSQGMVETGLAFFVGPDAASRSTSSDPLSSIYDDELGIGATPMIEDMMRAVAGASKESGLPLATLIGIDLRPRLAMGALAMHFLVVGRQVFVVQHTIREEEPLWEYLAKAGFSTLPYAPMQTAAIP